ncbi:MAG: thermonuclease family protein [Desulfobacterales bacterium]
MKKYQRHLYPILLSILLIGLIGATAIKQQWVYVKWVVDGDTIILGDGRHVRFIGINAPEIAHEGNKAEPFGYTAKKYSQHLLGSKKVRLEFDKEIHDRYGRLLGYIFLSNGTFANKIVLEKGYAYVLTRKPNVKYERTLLQSQRDAMSKRRGLWKNWKEKEGEYIGSEKSRRFHSKKCSYGKRIGKRNRIIFKTKWDAFWSGFAPCRKCLAGG